MSPLVIANVDGEPVYSNEAKRVIAMAVDRLAGLATHGVHYRLHAYRHEGREALATVWYGYTELRHQHLLSMTFLPALNTQNAWDESGINSADIAISDITDALLIIQQIVTQYEDRSGFAAHQVMSSTETATS